MAVQLIFNKHDAPATDAVVTFKRQSFFGPRAGTVDVSGRNPIRIRAVSYGWKRDSQELLKMIPLCYWEILQEAAARNCRSIAMPLASEKEPGFPRYWDYTMAMDAIQAFAAEHEMDVYLVMHRMAPPDDEKIQVDMDKFLEKMIREIERFHTCRQVWPEECIVQESQFGDDPDDEIEREVEREFAAYENSRFGLLDLDDADGEERIKILYDPETEAEIPLHADSEDLDELEPPPPPNLLWVDEDEIPPFPKLDDEDDLWDALDAPPAPQRSVEMTAPMAVTLPAPNGLPELGLGVPPSNEELTEFLECADLGFTDCLLACIDATGKKDSEIYNKARISRQLFSKIRNDPNYRPTKQTALAFAIALELNMEQTQDLIGRAGYKLNNNNKFDMIVAFFIRRKYYNLEDVNIALEEFGQKVLGV